MSDTGKQKTRSTIQENNIYQIFTSISIKRQRRVHPAKMKNKPIKMKWFSKITKAHTPLSSDKE